MEGGDAAGVALAVLGLVGLLGGVVFFGNKKDKGKAWMAQVGALAILSCTMLFSWAACASQTMVYYVGDGETEARLGVFTTFFSVGGGPPMSSGDNINTCDQEAWWSNQPLQFGQDDSDCRVAMAHRCYAAQTFAMFGVLANIAVVAALGLTMVGKLASTLPKSVLPTLVFFVSFSYMIVFSVWVPLYKSDPGDTSSCGLGLSENKDTALGPAFALFVINFLFSAIAAVGLTVFRDSELATFSSMTNKEQPTFDNATVVNEASYVDDNEI